MKAAVTVFVEIWACIDTQNTRGAYVGTLSYMRQSVHVCCVSQYMCVASVNTCVLRQSIHVCCVSQYMCVASVSTCVPTTCRCCIYTLNRIAIASDV